MAVVEQNSFASDICKVFGLNPNKTTSLTIKIVPDNIVMVDAEIIVYESEVDGIYKAMRHYEFKANAKNKNKK